MKPIGQKDLAAVIREVLDKTTFQTELM